MELHEHVLPFIIDSDFYEINQLRGIHFDHALIRTLTERWRCKTHTFHLRVGNMTPTLQDLLISLLMNGTPVTTCGGLIDKGALCDHILG